MILQKQFEKHSLARTLLYYITWNTLLYGFGARMYSRLSNLLFAGALAVMTAMAAMPARASVILQDTYYGGIDTWHYPTDVIGDAATFGISSAAIHRINGGNTLEITINTNYAGVPGTRAAYGTGYGVLFITPGPNAWTPQGSGPHYDDDTYQAGDWTYAATIPTNPGRYTHTGSGGLYLTSDGTIIMSNVYGNTTTYPYPGSGRYYFRENQPVQFTPDQSANPVANTSEQWTIAPGAITFDLTDNGLLGDQFALSWAMTCANDIIQGQVDVPEPPTWLLVLAGMFITGGLTWRRGSRSPV